MDVLCRAISRETLREIRDFRPISVLPHGCARWWDLWLLVKYLCYFVEVLSTLLQLSKLNALFHWVVICTLQLMCLNEWWTAFWNKDVLYSTTVNLLWKNVSVCVSACVCKFVHACTHVCECNLNRFQFSTETFDCSYMLGMFLTWRTCLNCYASQLWGKHTESLYELSKKFCKSPWLYFSVKCDVIRTANCVHYTALSPFSKCMKCWW